jgi:hypothetical protein
VGGKHPALCCCCICRKLKGIIEDKKFSMELFPIIIYFY